MRSRFAVAFSGVDAEERLSEEGRHAHCPVKKSSLKAVGVTVRSTIKVSWLLRAREGATQVDRRGPMRGEQPSSRTELMGFFLVVCS